MDTIVLILILLTAFNFLLKQTFWKPVAVGAAAGIATIFVILMWPYAIEQSKTQIADWLSDNQLMLDTSVVLTLEIVLQILPVVSSCGKLFSGEETYDGGLSLIVLVSGGVDYSGFILWFDTGYILFSRGFI